MDSMKPECQVECLKCEFVAINDRDLKNHIDRWHSKTSYPCNMCNFTANCPGKLTSHKNIIHRKWFPCDYCDYEGMSTKDRNRHIRASHNIEKGGKIRIRFKIRAHDIEIAHDGEDYYSVEEHVKHEDIDYDYDINDEYYYDIEEHVKKNVENVTWKFGTESAVSASYHSINGQGYALYQNMMRLKY